MGEQTPEQVAPPRLHPGYLDDALTAALDSWHASCHAGHSNAEAMLRALAAAAPHMQGHPEPWEQRVERGARALNGAGYYGTQWAVLRGIAAAVLRADDEGRQR